MAKKRRGVGPQEGQQTGSAKEPLGTEVDRDVDVAHSEVVGNAAFQASMGQGTGWASGSDLLSSLSSERSAATTGEQIAAVLRMVPRPGVEHARSLEILAASGLERKAELAQRLEALQAAAVGARVDLEAQVGPLDDAGVSDWAEHLQGAAGVEAAEVAEHAHQAAGDRSPGVASLTALCAAILARAGVLEEEEEPLGVDYGTEESGM